MNKRRFLIIDDDYGICQILSNIIEDYDLGEVIDTITDGHEGLKMIPKYKPDIVFIDLLLPGIDGIEIVTSIRKKHKDIDFIMISQVSDDDIISDAYESGIEFYISKPINVIEVQSVAKKVLLSQKNRRVIEEIGNTLNSNQVQKVKRNTIEDKIKIIFAELGILSEKGSSDLLDMLVLLEEKEHRHNIRVSKMYTKLCEGYRSSGITRGSSEKAIEQRVRRTIHTALVNIANLGIEDFGNPKFDRYASSLFSFQDVKKVMDCIRKKENIKGAINIKAFLNGMLSLIELN